MDNKNLITEIKDEQNIVNIKTQLHRRILIVAAVVVACLCIGGAYYYISEMRIVESGTVSANTTWSDNIIINGETIQVKMTFCNDFKYNKTEKTVELTQTDYEYSSSDENPELYFGDINITSEYSKAFFFESREIYISIDFCM